MLQQPDRLTLDQCCDHVGEHGADGVESLVRLADVLQAEVVEEDLLDDEDGDGLGEFGTGLHDSKAERDDLCGQKEVNHVGVFVLLQSAEPRDRPHLDERADHAQGGESKILEWPGLTRGVEKGIEK